MKRCKRLCKKKGTGWTIAIDDGYVAYKEKLNASKGYCINSLFKEIRKSVKKEKSVQ